MQLFFYSRKPLRLHWPIPTVASIGGGEWLSLMIIATIKMAKMNSDKLWVFNRLFKCKCWKQICWRWLRDQNWNPDGRHLPNVQEAGPLKKMFYFDCFPMGIEYKKSHLFIRSLFIPKNSHTHRPLYMFKLAFSCCLKQSSKELKSREPTSSHDCEMIAKPRVHNIKR